MNYFVTATDTDSGKTLVSAILAEALKADYWKPIQAGFPTDTDTIRELLSNTTSELHKETHLLKMPASPHAAAKYEGLNIQLEDFVLPQTQNDLIIEGAGGVLVPLNDQDFVIDIARQWNTPVILVSNLYLGSINHTLLTVNYLQKKAIPVKGIIFNGEANEESERIIERHSGYSVLLRLPKLSLVNRTVIQYWATELMLNWHE